jgi:hypothetical protein
LRSNSGWFVLEGLENKTDDKSAEDEPAEDKTAAEANKEKEKEKEAVPSSSAPSANLSRSIEDIKNELAAAVAASAAKEPDTEPTTVSRRRVLMSLARSASCRHGKSLQLDRRKPAFPRLRYGVSRSRAICSPIFSPFSTKRLILFVI